MSTTGLVLSLCLLGCQVPQTPEPAQPSPSPSVSAPTPTPLPEQVSPTPDISASPGPTPVPTSVPTTDPRIGVTHFTSQIACEDFSPEQLRRLEAPRDLVVSRDGQTLYITPESASVYQTESIARTPLYKLHNGRLEVINQVNNAAYSCGWNGEIERWQDDQVLFSYPQMAPGFDPRDAPIPIVGYGLYTHNGITSQRHGQIQTQVQNFQPHGIYHAPELMENLNLESSQLHYSLSTQGLIPKIQLETYDFATQQQRPLRSLLAINMGELFSNRVNDTLVLVNLKPSNTSPDTEFTFLNAPVSCPGWSSEKSPILSSQPRFYRGSYYFSDAINHMIWSHVPGSDIRCFAGGERGFADGKGQAARFREPAELVFDDAGNLYVADKGNDAIRKITPSGEVSTLYQADNP